jgi:glycogen debranching enzyme
VNVTSPSSDDRAGGGDGFDAPSPYAALASSVALHRPSGTITLVEGSSFCRSAVDGNIDPSEPHGLFVRDRRILSLLRLTIDGRPPEPLGACPLEPYQGVFVARASAPDGTCRIVVQRRRCVGDGLREELRVENLTVEAARLAVSVELAADFADVFAVKEGRVRAAPARAVGDDGFWRAALDPRWAVEAQARGHADVTAGRLTFDVVLEPRAVWSECIEITPVIDGVVLEPDFRRDRQVPDTDRPPAARRPAPPRYESDWDDLEAVLRRSVRDLAALRMVDPAHPSDDVVAAGAPWFMALFGRDSLLTAWMALPLGHDLALGVLRTLARFQGDAHDDDTEEEPGRILHELRFDQTPSLALGGGAAYFGSVDATPLFVMLAGELVRWGVDATAVSALLPAVDRALAWIDGRLAASPNGFLCYERRTARGLEHQAWKDSWDAIRRSDGSLARAPLALCEVQAYVHGAWLARARIAEFLGDDGAPWTERARSFAARFDTQYWLAGRGHHSLALDGSGEPIDALASNIGHLLWTGLVAGERADRTAALLLGPDLNTGFGIRTLARSNPGFDPLAYHCGSVWPHDTAIAAAGLRRCGSRGGALALVRGLIDASGAFGDRPPELFGGFDRAELAFPVAYPSSCSPQAWASAAPLLALRTLLGFEPELDRGVLRVDPMLPSPYEHLRVRDLRVGGASLDITVRAGELSVTGLPSGVERTSG